MLVNEDYSDITIQSNERARAHTRTHRCKTGNSSGDDRIHWPLVHADKPLALLCAQTKKDAPACGRRVTAYKHKSSRCETMRAIRRAAAFNRFDAYTHTVGSNSMQPLTSLTYRVNPFTETDVLRALIFTYASDRDNFDESLPASQQITLVAVVFSLFHAILCDFLALLRPISSSWNIILHRIRVYQCFFLVFLRLDFVRICW